MTNMAFNSKKFTKLKYSLKNGFVLNLIEKNTNIALKGFFLLLISFLLKADFLRAEEYISIDRAIELALSNSKDLQIAELNIQNTNNSLFLAQSTKSFRVDASINFEADFINKEDISFVNNHPEMDGSLVPKLYELEDVFLHKVKINLNLVRPLYNFGKLDNLSKAAQYGLDISKYKKQLLMRELRYIASRTYYTALLSNFLLELSRESHRKALSNRELLQTSIAKPNKIDLILAELHVSVQKSELEKAKQFKQDSYRVLNFICKIPENETIILTSNSEKTATILNKGELKKCLEENPEFVIFELSSNMYKHCFDAKKSARYPEFLVYLGYSGELSSDEIAFKKTNAENIIYAGVKIKAPVWDNGITEMIAQEEIIKKRKMDISSLKSKDTLLEQLNSTIEKHNSSIEVYENQKEIITSIRSSYEVSVDRFKAGKTNIAELNDVESKLVQASKRLHMLMFEINVFGAEIQKLVTVI